MNGGLVNQSHGIRIGNIQDLSNHWQNKGAIQYKNVSLHKTLCIPSGQLKTDFVWKLTRGKSHMYVGAIYIGKMGCAMGKYKKQHEGTVKGGRTLNQSDH
jgi:hypothetical protein